MGGGCGMKSSAQAAIRRLTILVVTVSLVVTAQLIVEGGGGQAAAASNSGGNLIVAEDLSGTAAPVEFDPVQFTTAQTYLSYDLPIYGGLLSYAPNGNLVPDLASKVTIENTSTIDVQVRLGVVFSDGTPFTAAAVKEGLERNINTTNKGGFNSQLFDISSIDVTGPDSLVLNFSQPVANVFYPLLANQESFIVSPKAAAAGTLTSHPVGAGPFMFESYAPNEKLVLVKNPKYWDAKNIHLSQITFLSVSTGPQQINALESGEINVVEGLPTADIPTLKALSSGQVKSVYQEGGLSMVPICKSSGPMANVKVRRALSDAVNRVQMVKALQDGAGQPAWTIYPKGYALYDKSLTGYDAYNPAKAKKLLAEAGYPHGFSTTMLPLAIPETIQVATFLQAEWKKIGVSVQILSSSNFVNDAYVRHIAAMVVNPPSGGIGLQKVIGAFLPGTIGDICGYNSPTLDALVKKAEQVSPSSAQYKLLWDQIQEFVIKNELAIYTTYSPTVAAASDSVKNLQILPYVGGVIDYDTASVS